MSEIDDSTGGTILDRGAFALVVTEDNEVQLFLPGKKDDDAPVLELALALVAVAERMKDPDWVKELLKDEFGQHN